MTNSTMTTDKLELLRQAVKDRKIRGLDGYCFCFTGTMSMKRDDMMALVHALGGSISSTVTANTTHLVAENIYGKSGKLGQARSRGVRIISEKQFTDMMDFRVN